MVQLGTACIIPRVLTGLTVRKGCKMGPWSVVIQGIERGPLSDADIRQLVARGVINGKSRIKGANGEWRPVVELFAVGEGPYMPPAPAERQIGLITSCMQDVQVHLANGMSKSNCDAVIQFHLHRGLSDADHVRAALYRIAIKQVDKNTLADVREIIGIPDSLAAAMERRWPGIRRCAASKRGCCRS